MLLETFAIDMVGAERFNTLIGLLFLAIVFFSPDGLLGLWEKIKPHLAQEIACGPADRRADERLATQSSTKGGRNEHHRDAPCWRWRWRPG